MRVVPFLLILISLSCGNKKEEGPTVSASIGTVEEHSLNGNHLKVNDSLYQLIQDININEVKKQYGRGSTSSILSKKSSKYLFEPDTGGFYGSYFFVNQSTNKSLPYLATAVVFCKEKPWNYSNKEEFLVEITTYSSDVVILSNVLVGKSKNGLINELGLPDLQEEDLLFYQDDKGAVLVVRLINDKVKAIRLGVYEKRPLNELRDILTKNI